MLNLNSKSKHKLLLIGCIAISLPCAFISGLIAGMLLALEYSIAYTAIFIVIGFAHVVSATKAYEQYRQL